MDSPATTQYTAPIRAIGNSWMPGHRLIRMDTKHSGIDTWVGQACLNSALNHEIAKLPASAIIMTIPKYMSDGDVDYMLENNNERVCGILIASRGVVQTQPCRGCQTQAGRVPFAECVIIDKYKSLGCASCVFRRGDSDSEEDVGRVEGRKEDQPSPKGTQGYTTNDMKGDIA